MRVIDLLNKIANREEVPKKVKYKTFYWEYSEKDRDYKDTEEDYVFSCSNYDIPEMLNNEVEIIEEDPEDKEITEHHDIFDYFTGYSFGETNKELLQQLEHNFQIVNEELDYLINKINS